MIKDGDGNWVVDSEKLEEMATKFYKDLYTKDFIYLPLVTSHAFPKLRDEAREELRRIPSLREIYQTIKQMGSLKALGPDGF